ncbi:MAG: hypothetical protein ACYDC1_22680 [Limisphaerales bacterium]
MSLTKQEQFVLATIISLLLLGWAVKAWRMAHETVPERPPTALR